MFSAHMKYSLILPLSFCLLLGTNKSGNVWDIQKENASTYRQESHEKWKKRKDYALFFAVDSYPQATWNDLKNPVRDAQGLARILKEHFGFTTEIHENPNKGDIYRVLKDWQNREYGEEDQLFVFVSGHGGFDNFEKIGFFVPIPDDGGKEDTHIPFTVLSNIISDIPCKHILLAIDACYSGTVWPEIANKSDSSKPGIIDFTQRLRFLKDQWEFKTRLAITSGGKEPTPDGERHSPFALTIMEGLKETFVQALSPGDGMFTYQDLVAQLARVTDPKPHEGKLPDHDYGGFVFLAKNAQIPTKEQPIKIPPTPPEVDLPTFHLAITNIQPISKILVNDQEPKYLSRDRGYLLFEVDSGYNHIEVYDENGGLWFNKQLTVPQDTMTLYINLDASYHLYKPRP